MVAVALIALGSLSACGGGGGGSGGGGSGGSSTGTGGGGGGTTPAFQARLSQNCPGDYPVPLWLHPENVAEDALKETIDVCTGPATADHPTGKGVYIHNSHESQVWVMDSAISPGAGLVKYIPADQLPYTRAVYEGWMREMGLVGVPLEPGQAYAWSDFDATDVRLSLDEKAQAAWDTLGLMIDTGKQVVGDLGQALMVELIGPTSRTRPAIKACVNAAFVGGSTILAADNHQLSFDNILALGSSTSRCGGALHDARQPAITAEDISQHLKVSKRWQGVQKSFDLIAEFKKFGGALFKLSPRVP